MKLNIYIFISLLWLRGKAAELKHDNKNNSIPEVGFESTTLPFTFESEWLRYNDLILQRIAVRTNLSSGTQLQFLQLFLIILVFYPLPLLGCSE